MKFLKLIVIILLISMFCCLNAEGNNNAVSYMRMGVGAKALAMGSAGVASMDNVTAAYWNPAALTRLNDFEVLTMITSNLGFDRNLNYAALGMKMKFGYVAVSWVNASMGDLQGYDASNNPTGAFDDNENSVGISYAFGLQRIRFGANAKMYSSNINDDSATGYGFDFGAIAEINEYMSLGLMIRDAFGELEDDDIPYQFTIGAAAYPYDGVKLEFDFQKEKDANDVKVSLGAEYWLSFGEDEVFDPTLNNRNTQESTSWSGIFSKTEGGLRAGADDGNFTAGFGIRFNNFETNYAFVTAPEDFMNDTHRFELILRF